MKILTTITNDILVGINPREKYFFMYNKKIIPISLPLGVELGSAQTEIIFFDYFRNEKSNEYYFEVYLKESGWFSIHKKGKYIMTNEPLDSRSHPYQFHTIDTSQKEVRKIHQLHLNTK